MKSPFPAFDLLIDKYISEKKSDLTTTTKYSIKSSLRKFGLFIYPKKEFDKTDLEAFLHSEKYKILKKSTQDNIKLTLRDFSVWYGINDLPVMKSSHNNYHMYFKKEDEISENAQKYYLLREGYIKEKLLNATKNTLNSKRSAINSFGEFIKFKTTFDRNDLIEYLNSETFKTLKASSQNMYKIGLRGFFMWRKIKNVDELLKKTKEKESELQPTDLITKKEIRLLLKKLEKPIHKAIIMLLLESKARKMEILSLKLKDLTFYDSYAMINIRKSKTKPRPIPIVESIPFLMRYLEDHPFVKKINSNILYDNPNMWLFGHYYNGEFQSFSKNYINEFLKRLIKREKNLVKKKKIYPHLFRHTGLTALAKANVNESIIRKIAGYTGDSTMIKRYVHLANDDVERTILELHGIKPPKEEEPIRTVKTKKCPRCDYINTELDKFCSRCGSVLDVKIALEHQEKAKELEEIISKSEIRAYIDKLFNEKLKIVKN